VVIFLWSRSRIFSERGRLREREIFFQYASLLLGFRLNDWAMIWKGVPFWNIWFIFWRSCVERGLRMSFMLVCSLVGVGDDGINLFEEVVDGL